ncbi:MAG: hypothetical protein EBZ91_11090 [Gammaproteobacteria bacterium]|nr:hypothetical protein [Gammaproteobacteria bacterium]
MILLYLLKISLVYYKRIPITNLNLFMKHRQLILYIYIQKIHRSYLTVIKNLKHGMELKRQNILKHLMIQI